MRYVYSFDHKHRRPPMEYKDLLGGKGANLAEMTSVLKLPVPPGFTISTDACGDYMDAGWPEGLDAEIEEHVAKLEKEMGRRLGDPADPLLVSVRSGAKFSMPGMMDTVLNLGLNDKSVKGLAKVTDDERFAYDSYRRFISMYARIVMGADGEPFEELLEEAREAVGGKTDADVPADALKQLCVTYKALVKEQTGKAFPQQPMKQLRGAVEAVFKSWNGARAIAYRVRENIDHHLGTAVNVQTMVFGNRDENSGTGVGFTRNAATGEERYPLIQKLLTLRADATDIIESSGIDVFMYPSTQVPNTRNDGPLVIEQEGPLGDTLSELQIGRTMFFAPAMKAPSIAMFSGMDPAGLPLSVTLDAATGADRRLLDVAEALEAILPALVEPESI